MLDSFINIKNERMSRMLFTIVIGIIGILSGLFLTGDFGEYLFSGFILGALIDIYRKLNNKTKVNT